MYASKPCLTSKLMSEDDAEAAARASKRVEAFERSGERLHIQLSVSSRFPSAVILHFHTDTDALCETAVGQSPCPLHTPVRCLGVEL